MSQSLIPPTYKDLGHFDDKRGTFVFDPEWLRFFRDLATSQTDLGNLTFTGTGSVVRQTLPTLTNPTVVGVVTTSSTTAMAKTSATLANGAGVALGTLANAPVAGNPTKWIPISDNGTIRYIPAW